MNFLTFWRKSAPADRSSDRQELSLVTAMRGEGGQRASVLIRDISDRGFRAECMARFRKGSRVIVELPGWRDVEAKVEWSRGDTIGVRFNKPIEVEAMLDAAGRA